MRRTIDCTDFIAVRSVLGLSFCKPLRSIHSRKIRAFFRIFDYFCNNGALGRQCFQVNIIGGSGEINKWPSLVLCLCSWWRTRINRSGLMLDSKLWNRLTQRDAYMTSEYLHLEYWVYLRCCRSNNLRWAFGKIKTHPLSTSRLQLPWHISNLSHFHPERALADHRVDWQGTRYLDQIGS